MADDKPLLQSISPPDIPSPTIIIEYCNRCRWQHRAAWFQTELLLTFPSPVIASIILIPLESTESSGRFRVWLRLRTEEYQLLWDRKSENGFPELKALKQRVRDHLQPERSLGHSDSTAPSQSTETS